MGGVPGKRRSPCGSGLAREGGASVAACVTAVPLSQASQLPHLIFVDFSVVFAWLCRITRLLSLQRDNELDIQAMFS